MQVTDNAEKKRFETKVENELAIIEYIKAKDTIYLTHTEVPRALEGKGIGSKLVKEVLGIVESEGYKLAPMCPFVAAYIKRHTEWKRILAPNYNV